MFNKTHSVETKALMSLALFGENHPMYNKIHYEENKNKIRKSKGTSIFVYLSEGKTLINSFSSAIKAGEFLNVSYHTVLKYAKTGKLLKTK
jgi:group I intron endonuclease